MAARAEAGARTVYRYFPSQVDLFQAVWERLGGQVALPLLASEIVESAEQTFERFDTHERMVMVLLPLLGGDDPRARVAFDNCLAHLTTGMEDAERGRVVAVFVALCSAPFWQLLRDRGGQSGPEARAALIWTLETLLAALQKAALPRRRAEP